jgi:hypothetical protein
MISSDQALKLAPDQLLKLRAQLRPNVQFVALPDGGTAIVILPDDGIDSGRPACAWSCSGNNPCVCE